MATMSKHTLTWQDSQSYWFEQEVAEFMGSKHVHFVVMIPARPPPLPTPVGNPPEDDDGAADTRESCGAVMNFDCMQLRFPLVESCRIKVGKQILKVDAANHRYFTKEDKASPKFRFVWEAGVDQTCVGLGRNHLKS